MGVRQIVLAGRVVFLRFSRSKMRKTSRFMSFTSTWTFTGQDPDNFRIRAMPRVATAKAGTEAVTAVLERSPDDARTFEVHGAVFVPGYLRARTNGTARYISLQSRMVSG